MSDASMPRCDECNEPIYACICVENTCVGCGTKLSKEAIEQGRDLCLNCYFGSED
jgi:hypothetical protein